MKKLTIPLILIYFVLTIQSCVHNYEPQISSISADPNPVQSNGSVSLICKASDDDEANIFRDEKLTFEWFATYGSIVSENKDNTAKWTAPADTGIYSISCTVSDQSNGLDIAIIDITVK